MSEHDEAGRVDALRQSATLWEPARMFLKLVTAAFVNPADNVAMTGDEYYPGTSVLINLENIRDPEQLLERETKLQLAAYEEMFVSFDETLTPNLPFFYYLHHMMFSRLYG